MAEHHEFVLNHFGVYVNHRSLQTSTSMDTCPSRHIAAAQHTKNKATFTSHFLQKTLLTMNNKHGQSIRSVLMRVLHLRPIFLNLQGITLHQTP